MEQENNKKEFDLIDVFKWLWNTIVTFILKPLFFIIKYTIKKWWLIPIACVVGCVLSCVMYKAFPVYSGYNIIFSKAVVSGDFVNDITMLYNSSPKEFAKETGIPLKEVLTIKTIKPHYIYVSEDSVKATYTIDFEDDEPKFAFHNKIADDNRFCIELEASDTTIFKHFDEGIKKHLNSNIVYSKMLNKRLEDISKRVEILSNEIAKIDSLSYAKGNDMILGLTGSGKIMSSMVDPASLARQRVEMGLIKNNCEIEVKNFTELFYFSVPMHRSKLATNHPLLTYYYYIIFSYIGILAISLCVSYKEKLKEIFKL